MNRTYHKRGMLIDGVPPRQHPLYATWAGMLSRCTNRKSKLWQNYGGRGITVCNRWYHFVNFVADMVQKPTPAHTLDRCDNDRGYTPSNCKWSTRTEQCVNRRRFATNTTGAVGVVQVSATRFNARYDSEYCRHNLGSFTSLEDASQFRSKFVELFKSDPSAAIQTVVDREVTWCTSSTGHRGVTAHKDGGYIVRKTVNGVRHYVGYFQTIEGAIHAKSNFNTQ